MENLHSLNDLRALIITGRGEAFSAGGSYQYILDRHRDSPFSNRSLLRHFYGLFLDGLKSCPIPTIAAVNGHAMGAGFGVALGCDFRVVSKHALMGAPFTKLGIHPGMGMLFLFVLFFSFIFFFFSKAFLTRCPSSSA